MRQSTDLGFTQRQTRIIYRTIKSTALFFLSTNTNYREKLVNKKLYLIEFVDFSDLCLQVLQTSHNKRVMAPGT